MLEMEYHHPGSHRSCDEVTAMNASLFCLYLGRLGLKSFGLYTGSAAVMYAWLCEQILVWLWTYNRNFDKRIYLIGRLYAE